MGIDQTISDIITCDNPSCPNAAAPPNGLKAADRTGWIIVTYEIYGAAVTSRVFCSAQCAAAYATDQEASVTATQKALTGAA